jgi:single-strand DNA-binding protein
MQGTTVTFVGNLTGDPELRYTPTGTPVANFDVAVNNRKRNAAGEWEDGEATFYRVAVFREYGEHVAESLTKGSQVLVVGRLATRTWEGQDGNSRQSLDVIADEIGPTLRWSIAKLSKVARTEGGQGQGQGQQRQGKDFNDEPPF